MQGKFKMFMRMLAPFGVALVVVIVFSAVYGYISGRVAESVLQSKVEADLTQVQFMSDLEGNCPSHNLNINTVTVSQGVTGVVITCATK